MATADFDADAYVRAVAAALGIALNDEQVPGVAANLQRTAELADLLLQFELADDDQPAPVFRP